MRRVVNADILRRERISMAQSRSTAENADPIAAVKLEEAITYLAKRHRVTPAIVREIVRRLDSSERAAVEREINKGKTRR
jgi:hypothetical protein